MYGTFERGGGMLFDTDVLIWCLRGNAKAAKQIQESESRYFSAVGYMELIQGARNKNEIKTIRSFLKELDFHILPLTENIGHRACVYMEEYCLKVELSMADALVAATAAENQQVLCTGNTKHFKVIAEVETRVFRP